MQHPPLIPSYRITLLLLLSAMALLCAPLITSFGQDKPALTEEQKKKIAAVKDAASKVGEALTVSERARRSASANVTLISSRSSFEEANDLALDDLEALTEVAREIGAGELIADLDAGNTALEKAKTDLTAARDALPTGEGLPEEIGAARKEADAMLTSLNRQSEAVKKVKGQLQTSLTGIPTNVKRLAELVSARMSALADTPKEADENVLLQVLPTHLSDFRESERLRRDLRARWRELAAALKAAGAESAEGNTAVTEALSSVDSRANTILQNMKTWLSKVNSHVQAKKAALSDLSTSVMAGTAEQTGLANKLAREASDLSGDLDRINEAWTNLSAQLTGVAIPNFDLRQTKQTAEDLAGTTRALGIATAVLQDAVTGDFGEFVADQVSLYYFTDVPRIIQMLNGGAYQVGGIKDAQARAAEERRRLTGTELDVFDAQREVNKRQQRVLELQEELRRTKSVFNAAQIIKRRTSLGLQGAQRDHTRTEARFNKAKEAHEAAPNDPEKKAAYDRAQEEIDQSSARVREYTERDDDAKREHDAAKERDDAAKNEQVGLPARIQEAKDQLEVAQTAVNRQRRAALLATQAEADAFVAARDNTPYWFAPATGSSTDPVKRVLLYAFNDSKTIFLRGKQDDVNKVKDIIARFDKPAPQARLTLWTMELSSDTSDKGTRNFNKALQIIEEELANTRALNAAALSFLRDCINEEVNQHASVVFGQLSTAGLDEADRLRLARIYFYQPEILTRLGLPSQPHLLTRSNARTIARFSRLTIPDPSGTTTLGEALMVLSLGARPRRENVLNAFAGKLAGKLDGLGLEDSTLKKGEIKHYFKNGNKIFTSTRRALGLDLNLNNPGYDGQFERLTAHQLEILHAIEATAFQKAKDQIRELENRIRRDQAILDKLSTLAASRALTRDEALLRLNLSAEQGNWIRQLLPIINWTRSEFGLDPSRDLQPERFADPSEADIKSFLETSSQTINAASGLNPLRTANARVAAADQMLKEIIIAFEDDLDRHFVQPMLNRLRERITRGKIGVGVGVMQRTSMLATNRLLARVDPRASAQLGVGQEQDILGAVQQLAQIYLSAQSGGVLGALGTLDAQPREAPPEIYGITTGNTFQVTPIFDPSGQALRFKFDHVGTTRIQEPDGTTSRQLPRIERHTVNTEVQLTNLEMREVSRFEANSRIGRPTEYTGGLPIIKDIPKVRPYLPLVGWFVRKGGKAAVVQQSLIFGQTTMYPTIGDIMDLLTTPVVLN